MSSNSPDFSSSFDLVQDKLDATQRRLEQKRKHESTPVEKTPPETLDLKNNPQNHPKFDELSPRPSATEQGKRTRKKKRISALAAPIRLSVREIRRNLTLKVLEENEMRFNQLFHKLQLAGDVRKKQDLADEALDLLFQKYKEHLD